MNAVLQRLVLFMLLRGYVVGMRVEGRFYVWFLGDGCI